MLLRKEQVWGHTDLISSIEAMHDGHSHLDRWATEVGQRKAWELIVGMSYETVTSDCFSKWWLDSKT